MRRVILHYDMDAFYASIEIRDNPKLKGLPIVVGSSIVTTASYEARRFGIHSAMSTFEAKRLCSNLIVIPVNKDKYIEISDFIHSLVLKITEKIEFIALDEGYIDMTGILTDPSEFARFAQKFRERIFHHTKLTCSVGIGFNKLTAKMGSNMNKPRGQYIFYDKKQFVKYIKEKDIGIIPGVGKKFKALLNKNNIFLVKDLYPYSLNELVATYGKARGELLYLSIRGIDHSKVDYDRERFSIGNENTYRYAITDEVELKKEFFDIFNHSYERLVEKKVLAKTINIKVKFEKGKTITRAKTIFDPTDDRDILYLNMEELIGEVELQFPIKLVGVSFSNLIKKSVRQLTFF